MTNLSCGVLCAVLSSTLSAAPVADTRPILASSNQTECVWASRELAVRVFDSEITWKAIYPSGLPQGFKQAPNWKDQVVIALTLGAKPSPGYGIAFTATKFEQRGSSLYLDFREQRPAAGDMHEQVMTQPCVLLLTERGNWQTLIFRNAASGEELRAKRSGK